MTSDAAMRNAQVMEHARLMVLDDDAANLQLLDRVLRRAGYRHVRCMTNPNEAFAAYTEFRPDIILLDLHMPHLSGFDVLAELRHRVEHDAVPVIVLTGDPSADSVRTALSSGAKDFVAKPFEAVELLLRVRNLLETRFAHIAVVEQKDLFEQRVIERTRDLVNAELATLQLLARAAEFRDDDTGRHTQRVGTLSALLADRLGCDREYVELIRNAAPLHDIGKIGVPDHILLKPGALTSAERAIMQRHAAIGADILATTDFPILRAARDIALSHHERWDGTGYPRGVAAGDAPLSARIVAVADVFDALRHDRPYRAGLPLDEVMTLIRAGAGSHLDPEIVEALVGVVDEIDSDTLPMWMGDEEVTGQTRAPERGPRQSA